MSQRGGSVVTYVRFGDKVYSPIVDKGEADFIVSFELLEAARYTEDLKPGGKIITSTQQINPMPVITGAAQYPQHLEQTMKDAGIDVDAFDALSLAEQAGSSKAVNLVLMGRLSRYFDFTEEEWLEAIGAINDADYAALLARHYGEMGYGPQRVRDKLYEKGVPRELWEEALDQLPDNGEQIDRFLQSKLRGRTPEEKEKKRLTDALLRRGYSWSDVKAAWNRLGTAVEEDE